jgi:hypothetical protein
MRSLDGMTWSLWLVELVAPAALIEPVPRPMLRVAATPARA